MLGSPHGDIDLAKKNKNARLNFILLFKFILAYFNVFTGVLINYCPFIYIFYLVRQYHSRSNKNIYI